MKRKVCIKFQKRLLICFSIVLICSIGALTLHFYLYMRSVVTENILQSLMLVSSNAAVSANTVIREMDYIAMSIIGNKSLTDALGDIGRLDNNDLFSDSQQRFKFQKNLDNLVFSINTPLFISRRVTVFSDDGRFLFSSGISDFSQQVAIEQIKELDWLDAVLTADGARVITPPHQSPWSLSKNSAFSLTRLIKTRHSRQLGIVEVEQNTDVLAQHFSSKTDGQLIVVTDRSGQLIYPDDYPFAPQIVAFIQSGTKKSGTLPHMLGGERYLYSTDYADYPEWNITVLYSQSSIIHSLTTVSNTILLSGFALLVFTIFVVSWVTQRLSLPIKTLMSQIDDINLQNMQISVGDNVMHDEFQHIYGAFNEMLERLSSTVNESLAVKESEMQTYMLALQSQMSPHFLYNTLNTIGIVAGESGQPHIEEMCAQLVRMLQYVSNYNDASSTLLREVDHAKDYLSLMLVRYDEKLHCRFDISGELSDVNCPKLIIEPIVENAINHGLMHVMGSWEIVVHVEVLENGGWYIAVSDNGCGFDTTTLHRIEAAITDFDSTIDSLRQSGSRYPESGIGILNTYFRLHVYYHGKVTLSIKNLDSGGCIVMLTRRGV